jgi:predicted dehydrogenase
MTTTIKRSRRDFLKTAAALVAPAIIPGAALGYGRPAPSNRIQVGCVGLGSQGTYDMRDFLKQPDAQVVAVCDVQRLHYRERPWGTGPAMGREPARRAVERAYATEKGSGKASGKYKGCDACSDFRELCGRKDIDAVLVGTPDHWHAMVALAALRQGKDVYGEKPFTHFFAEGQVVYREVARQKAVYQVGSQQRSDALFRQAVELVRNGHLGPIKRVEVGLGPGYAEPKGDATVRAVPDGLDYDMWCGPAPVLPYMVARHHRWWRGNRAFGGGVLMDWIGHHNDIAHWGLDMDHAGPLSVEAVGWTMPQTDIYNTPVDYEMHCEYPGAIKVVISTKVQGGTKWIGEHGWLWVNRGKIKASDKRWLDAKFERGEWKAYVSTGHVRNFLDCVKSREASICPAETGHRSVTPGHLGYLSQAVGRPLRWDAAKEEIVDDAAAQAMLMAMSYRKPWQV